MADDHINGQISENLDRDRDSVQEETDSECESFDNGQVFFLTRRIEKAFRLDV